MIKTVKVLKIKNKAMCTLPCLIRTAQKMARCEIHKKMTINNQTLNYVFLHKTTIHN